MKNTHLTDEILQEYLLHEIQDDTIASHLAECSNCKKRLEEYQFLMDGMKKMTSESFAFDVTALAMDSILHYEKKQSKKQEWFFWGLLILLSFVILSFSFPFVPRLLSMFTLKSIFATLLVFVTGVMVLFFLLADLTQQYKRKEEKLFKNNLQPTL